MAVSVSEGCCLDGLFAAILLRAGPDMFAVDWWSRQLQRCVCESEGALVGGFRVGLVVDRFSRKRLKSWRSCCALGAGFISG
jgi:hypothetical protein